MDHKQSESEESYNERKAQYRSVFSIKGEYEPVYFKVIPKPTTKTKLYSFINFSAN